MKTFLVDVYRIFGKSVSVDANTRDEAMLKAMDKVSHDATKLCDTSWDDCNEMEIKVVGELVNGEKLFY